MDRAAQCTWTIQKSPSDKDTLTNCAIVYPGMFGGIKHISLEVVKDGKTRKTYFSVRSSPAIGNNKYIGLGEKQREWAGAEIGTPVKVEPYTGGGPLLGSLTIEVTFLEEKLKKAPTPYDTDKMSQDFKTKTFQDQIFAKDQGFFLSTENKPILLAKVSNIEVFDPAVLSGKKSASPTTSNTFGIISGKTEVFFERSKDAPNMLQLTGHHVL